MKTFAIALIVCVFIVTIPMIILTLCLRKKKELVSDGLSQQFNNQRSRAVTGNGDFIIYPAAASLPRPPRKSNDQRSRAVTSNGDSIFYPAAPSLLTISNSGDDGHRHIHHQGQHGGNHHNGHHGGAGGGHLGGDGGGYHGGGVGDHGGGYHGGGGGCGGGS